jgi:hypothetical protein
MVTCMQEDNLDIYGRTHMIDCPLGVPGLSIPIGLAADSMPIGIMLYGRPGDKAFPKYCPKPPLLKIQRTSNK